MTKDTRISIDGSRDVSLDNVANETTTNTTGMSDGKKAGIVTLIAGKAGAIMWLAFSPDATAKAAREWIKGLFD